MTETTEEFIARREVEMAAECTAVETPELLAECRRRWLAQASSEQATADRLQAKKPFAKARSTIAQKNAECSAQVHRSLADACLLPAHERSYSINYDIASMCQRLAKAGVLA